MADRRFFRCVLFLATFGVVGHQLAEACEFKKVAPYYRYLNENRCPNDNEDGCLQETSYIATRSDGRRVRVSGVYLWLHEHAFWKDADDVRRVHVLPHFLLGYMRALRDAYEACPAEFHQQLFNQIDFVVSRAVVRGATPPARVWENRYGITQGMEQAEMASLFASVARLYARFGAREALGTMRYAFEAIQSLFIPVGYYNGGVRSIVADACGAKAARFRPCFWFHSRGVGVDTDFVEHVGDRPEDRVATVLNQHLHVISSTLSMYKDVSRVPGLVPAEYGGRGALARLEDRAIGGLYQLAFSRGNNSAAPNRPPRLSQFMRHDTDLPWFPFYFSYYRLDLSDRTFRNISPELTCHYHTHSLKMMSDIKTTLDRNVALFSASGNGWRLYEAVDRIFNGSGEPMGQAGSQNAIWQFWLAQLDKYTPAVGCVPCKDRNNNSVPCDGDREVSKYYTAIW